MESIYKQYLNLIEASKTDKEDFQKFLKADQIIDEQKKHIIDESAEFAKFGIKGEIKKSEGLLEAVQEINKLADKYKVSITIPELFPKLVEFLNIMIIEGTLNDQNFRN